MPPTSRTPLESTGGRTLTPGRRRFPPALALLLLAALAPASAAPPCTWTGTAGNDVYTGDGSNEVLCGLGGNDTIDGAGGDDVLIPGPGDDAVTGGDGVDEVSYEGAAAGVTLDLAAGTGIGEGSDTLTSVEDATGSAHPDVLRGSSGPNTLNGLGATDLLFGRGGGDALFGGDGEDYLEGMPGDLLDGGDATDTCTPQGVSCLPPSPPDADDVPGFLDASQVELFRPSAARGWTLRTFGRWTARRMWDHGFVIVYLDTFGAELFDYRIVISSNGRGFRARLFRANDRRGRLDVWRKDRRGASVRLPLERIRRDFPYVRWYAVTMTDRCSRWCLDRIPDQGAMVEPL